MKTLSRHDGGIDSAMFGRVTTRLAYCLLFAVSIVITSATAQSQCSSCQDAAPTTVVATINSSTYYPGTNCDIKVTFKQYVDCPNGPCELEITSIEHVVGSGCAGLSDGRKIELAITAALEQSPCTPSYPSVTTQMAVYMGACIAAAQYTINGVTYRGLAKCGELCCGALYVLTWSNGKPNRAQKVADLPAAGASCPPINPYEVVFTSECKSACDYFPDDIIIN